MEKNMNILEVLIIGTLVMLGHVQEIFMKKLEGYMKKELLDLVIIY